MRKWLKNRGIRQWISILAGMLLTAIPFPLFFIPNDIAPGGVTGVGTLVHALSGLPVGTVSAVLNLPLFLISWKRMGRLFAVKSLIAMLGLSLFIDLLPLGPVTDDPMLAAIFGGVLLGLGIGLVIRGGATTGGSDMAATLIHERFPVITVGGVLLAIDCCIILASSLVFSLQSAMFSMIALFLATQVMDRTVEGLGSAKAFFVFSDHTPAIARAVLSQMERGATLLHGQGAYSGQEREVLLCVITRLQIPQFKAIVQTTDPKAFMMVTDVREAVGEGFTWTAPGG